MFVTALLPVIVASTIALIKTIKSLKKLLANKEEKNGKRESPTKKIVELVWYSLLIVVPLLIACITLTNL
jgi:hypothetical protein